MTDQAFELRLQAAYDKLAGEAIVEVDPITVAAVVTHGYARPKRLLSWPAFHRPGSLALVLAGLLLILATFAMAVVGSMLLEKARDFRGVIAPAPDMSAARDRPVVVALSDGRVVIAGGQLAASTDPISVEIFDPRNGEYSSFSGDVPTGSGSGLLLPDGRVLITVFDLSRSSAGYGGIYLLDPELVTARFVSLPDVPKDLTSAIGPPLGEHPAIALLQSGNVLIVGDGMGGPDPSKAFVFDPLAELLTPVGSLAEPRTYPSITTLLDGRVLVAGGRTSCPCSLYFGTVGLAADAEMYDPDTRHFTAVGSMPSVRGNANGFLMPNGNVLIEQAGDNTTRFGEAQGPIALDMFTPGPDTFTKLDPGDWPGPPTVTQLTDGRLLLTGMASGTPWAATYDALTGTTSPLPSPRAIFPQGATTTDGHAVLVGGYTDPPLTPGNPAVPWTDVVR